MYVVRVRLLAWRSSDSDRGVGGACYPECTPPDRRSRPAAVALPLPPSPFGRMGGCLCCSALSRLPMATRNSHQPEPLLQHALSFHLPYFFPISPLDCAASQTLCHGNRQPLTPQVLATVTHLALFRRCSAADARYSDTILQMMAAGVDFDTEDKAVMEAALVNKVAVDSASLPLPEWPRRSSRDSEGGGGGSRRSSRSGCVPAPH